MQSSTKCIHQFKTIYGSAPGIGEISDDSRQFPPWFDCTKENVNEIRSSVINWKGSTLRLNSGISRGIHLNFDKAHWIFYAV